MTARPHGAAIPHVARWSMRSDSLLGSLRAEEDDEDEDEDEDEKDCTAAAVEDEGTPPPVVRDMITAQA